MKKWIAIGFLLVIPGVISAQDSSLNQNRDRTYFLEKSKNQKTTGYIMLIGGGVATIAGSILFAENFDLFSSESDPGETGGAILVAVGAGSMVGSIFLFSAASRNKQKAYGLRISLEWENRMTMKKQDIRLTRYPALSLQLSLRNNR